MIMFAMTVNYYLYDPCSPGDGRQAAHEPGDHLPAAGHLQSVTEDDHSCLSRLTGLSMKQLKLNAPAKNCKFISSLIAQFDLSLHIFIYFYHCHLFQTG